MRRDAAQEALAKVCVRLKQFRGDSQFSTWLHRLVVNTCLDAAERRKARVHEPLRTSMLAVRTHDPARAAGISELRRELCDALADVSPHAGAGRAARRTRSATRSRRSPRLPACRSARRSVTRTAGARA